MGDLERYTKLKKKIDNLRQQAAKAEGGYEEVLKRLENEFDCSSLDEAEELLKDLKKEEKEAREEFAQKLAEFEDEWAEFLA